jgi:outer membrane receptor protein involved in Fe transport
MSNSRCLVSVSSAALVIAGMLLTVPRTGLAQIEEIVVTTRKKTESLQDLPIAVDAIGAQQIERQGITNIEDVTKLSPSVQFDQSYGPADNRVAIRGLSNTRGRSNVAFLVDGIDVTSENLISAGSGLLVNQRLLNDVERIEIVKGPQSALYGRAAFAGAISYITKEPGDELETKIRLDVAEYGKFQMDGSIGGPIAGLEDKLGIRASGVYWTEDGAYINSVSGEQIGGGEGYASALTGVFTPTDLIKVKGRVEYSRDKLKPRPVVRAGGGTSGVNLTLREYPASAITPYCDLVLADPNSPQSQKDQCSSGSDYKIDFAACEALPPGMARDDCFAGVNPSVDPSGNGRYIDPNLPPGNGPGQLDARDNVLNKTVVLPPFGYGSATATGLLDFNQYCPPELQDPSKGPGYCLPSSFGSVDDYVKPNGDLVTLSEDPFTGQDYPGTETELLRLSLLAEIDMDYGMFSSRTGFTDYNFSDKYDQDYQAQGRPDQLTSNQLANTDGTTEQFSQELRFQSEFEGPWQFALGGFYWQEERSLLDRNYIISCLNHSVNKLAPPGTPGRFPDASGLCDGTPDSVSSPPIPTVGPDFPWQQMALSLPPCLYDANGDPIPDPTGRAGCQQGQRTGSPWQADTDHWSIYGSFDFELAESWTVTMEDRYVNEDYDLLRTNFSSCGALALPITPVFSVGNNSEPNPVTDVSQDITCIGEKWLNPDIPSPGFDTQNNQNWTLIEGSVHSSFHTPKITTTWEPTADTMVYFSWARAQKPGGINQLAAGGSATTIDFERFDPEKMEAWEIGTKTEWEAAGFVRFNGSVFFNDYTDKQIGTQVVRPGVGGALTTQPRVVNAAAAEVWGLELEATWAPKWVEGLSMTLAYTYLDATFTDFMDRTRSTYRTAAAGDCDVVYLDENDNAVDPDSLFVLPSSSPDPAPAETFDAAQFCSLDLSGNRLERSPEHAAVFQLNYTAAFGDTGADWFTETNVNYEDERFIDSDNFIKFDDYFLMDVRAGLTGEKWEVLLYIDNFLSDKTIRTGGTGPDFATQVEELGFTAGLGTSDWFGVMPDPRTFGMRLTMMF